MHTWTNACTQISKVSESGLVVPALYTVLLQVALELHCSVGQLSACLLVYIVSMPFSKTDLRSFELQMECHEIEA